MINLVLKQLHNQKLHWAIHHKVIFLPVRLEKRQCLSNDRDPFRQQSLWLDTQGLLHFVSLLVFTY